METVRENQSRPNWLLEERHVLETFEGDVRGEAQTPLHVPKSVKEAKSNLSMSSLYT